MEPLLKALQEIGVGLAAFALFAWILVRVVREVKGPGEQATRNGINGRAGEASVSYWRETFREIVQEISNEHDRRSRERDAAIKDELKGIRYTLERIVERGGKL